MKISKKEFLRRAREIWGNKYNYDNVDLEHRVDGKVCITCPSHGDFYVSPNAHIRSDGKASGCKLCSGHHPYTNEDVIRRANEIYGTERYDFSSIDVDKRDADGKVTVICRVHGKFKITINNLLKKGRMNCCPKCSRTNHPYTTESFIKKATKVHNGYYTYPHLVYNGINNDVLIECPIHGEFTQKAKYHIRGAGCPLCNPAHKSNKEEFVSKARAVHGDKYDYSKVIYKSSTTPVEIICPSHGSFFQEPNDHLTGNGCPNCHISKLETMVKLRLEKENIVFERQFSFKDLKDKRLLKFDFYLPQNKIAIECQGEQHFGPVEQFGGKPAYVSNLVRDQTKREYCKKHGIRLLYYSAKPHEYADTLFTSLDDLILAIKDN